MWRAVFDSVQGTSHVSSGTPCQDACRVVTWPSLSGDVLIVACADGAGSATHSHVGALTACDVMVEKAVRALEASNGAIEQITREDVVAWYATAKDRVLEEARALQVPPRELACTLLFAIVGPSYMVFSQLGDGAIVVKRGEEYAAVFWPQSGEYANTTNFLTSERIAEIMDFASSDGEITDLAVFTDGLERLVLRFAEHSVHRPSLEPLFAHLRNVEDIESLFAALRQFLDSKPVNDRTDDDKTLVLASRV